jgi:hypothetical protein
VAEPPKPITRLAEPIDRSGPRAANDVGGFAVVVAVLAAAAVALGFGTREQAFALIGFLFTPAGLVLGIVALVRASNRHLRRASALVAVILSSILMLMWAAALVLLTLH